jgi:multidrug resistance efflux pump
LFDSVSEGQTLAVLDTVLDNEQPRPDLQAQLETIRARIEHLKAEANANQGIYTAQVDNQKTQYASDLRAFADNITDARLRVLESMTVIETDKLVLEGLKVDIQSFLVQGRLDVNDVAFYELKNMRLNRDSLAKKIEQNGHLLAQSREELNAAINRRDDFVNNHPEPYLGSPDEMAQDVTLKATRVLELQVKELMVQLRSLDLREALELKSPSDGSVSLIHRRPGETVLAGEPILTITEVEPTEIIAYATEDQMSQIREGMPVELVKNSEQVRTQIERSEVTYVGPVVEQMPVRLWQSPNVPEWGRPFVIKAPAQMKLLIGEKVGIRGP